MGPAFDIGFTSLALGIQRVEVLLQTRLGRIPGIDRTALSLRSHGAYAWSPKKRGPDQRVPVMARATSERLA